MHRVAWSCCCAVRCSCTQDREAFRKKRCCRIRSGRLWAAAAEDCCLLFPSDYSHTRLWRIDDAGLVWSCVWRRCLLLMFMFQLHSKRPDFVLEISILWSHLRAWFAVDDFLDVRGITLWRGLCRLFSEWGWMELRWDILCRGCRHSEFHSAVIYVRNRTKQWGCWSQICPPLQPCAEINQNAITKLLSCLLYNWHEKLISEAWETNNRTTVIQTE